MRKIVLAAAVAAGLSSPAAAQLRPGPGSVADVASNLLDAVVNIAVSQNVTATRGAGAPEGTPPFREFFDQFFDQQKQGDGAAPPAARTRRVQSLGSGFVIDAGGIIVTNFHVVEDADEITVNFTDGTKLSAKLIGRDSKTDLAVLEVKPSKPLKALKFGDSERMRVGDWVMAIGNPFGLGGTLTVGILSARNRDINSGPYDDFLQTDAAINRGNSGGPLFNMDGEVIGINTAIISPSGGSIGIGFAVPSDTAMHVIEQLREFGETRRGSLGVKIQPVSDDIAEALAMDRPRGALVSGVNAGSPAEEAGIKTGDVVVEFNGRTIREMRDLPRLVGDETAGREVPLKVLRDGKEVQVTVKLALLEEAKTDAKAPAGPGESKDEAPKIQVLGLKTAAITPELRTKYALKQETSGVVVTDVEPNSLAAEKGIQPGMVIVEISQQAVLSPDDVTKRLDDLKTEKRRMALFLLADKSGDMRFVPLKLE
jgi:serine protease Do